MRAIFFIPVLSALSLAFAGCATPPENPQLLQARSQFSSLQQKPESNTLAAVETRIASNALDRANQVSLHDRTDPQLDQLAYLATQKIALAEQTIVGRKTDAQLDNIAVDRTQVQLDVRTAQLKALQAMKAQPTERGQVITFGDVLFDTGKADLKAGSQRDFQGLANFLDGVVADDPAAWEGTLEGQQFSARSIAAWTEAIGAGDTATADEIAVAAEVARAQFTPDLQARDA